MSEMTVQQEVAAYEAMERNYSDPSEVCSRFACVLFLQGHDTPCFAADELASLVEGIQHTEAFFAMSTSALQHAIAMQMAKDMVRDDEREDVRRRAKTGIVAGDRKEYFRQYYSAHRYEYIKRSQDYYVANKEAIDEVKRIKRQAKNKKRKEERRRKEDEEWNARLERLGINRN